MAYLKLGTIRKDDHSLKFTLPEGTDAVYIIPGYRPLPRVGKEAVYPYEGKTTLEAYLKQVHGRKEILGLFDSLISCIKEGNKRGISAEIVMNLSAVFVDENSGKAEMLCIPSAGEIDADSFALFLKVVLSSVKADPSEDRNYIADILTELNEEDLSIHQFYVFIRKMEGLPVVYLASTDTDSITEITKDEFTIGKEKEQVDFFIDNKYVSHKHAKIIHKGDGWYLMDTKSSNHSYINEKRLVPWEAEKLRDGDTVRFAKVSFVFHES